MLTATLIRDAWGAVVNEHQGDPGYQSWWDQTLDRPVNVPYALCVWLPPDPLAEVATTKDGIVTGTRAGFTVNIELRDRVSPSRTPAERDAVHSKMAMYLHQMFALFVRRYVIDSTALNSYTLNLRIVQPMTSSSFYDEAPDGETGVQARFAIMERDTMHCAAFTSAYPA